MTYFIGCPSVRSTVRTALQMQQILSISAAAPDRGFAVMQRNKPAVRSKIADLAQHAQTDLFIPHDTVLVERLSAGKMLFGLSASVIEDDGEKVAYNLDFVRSLTPEYVVIEIVERNLPDLIVGTPTMDAPLRPSDTVESAVPTVSDSVSITVEDKDTRYFITGTVDPDLTDDDSPVYIRVNTPDGPLVYEAFAQSEYSFGLYISKIQFFSIEVITSSNDILYSVST